jgi:hypothetical protein
MRFYKVTVSGSFLPDAPGRSLGSVGFPFLEIHSDDFLGNIKAADGDTVLDNGATLADAYFAGDLVCNDGSGIVMLMENKNTPGAVLFRGTATKAKYA